MTGREFYEGGEGDEERTVAMFEEIEAEYAVEELNVLEGLPERGEWEYRPGPTIILVVE